VLGIAGVDTRAITRRLRETGCLNGVITTDASISDDELVSRTKVTAVATNSSRSAPRTAQNTDLALSLPPDTSDAVCRVYLKSTQPKGHTAFPEIFQLHAP